MGRGNIKVMKITIKSSGLELTPMDKKDMDRHIAKLRRLVAKYGSGVTLDIEVSRMSNHHRKGMVYQATATLIFHKKMMRSQ